MWLMQLSKRWLASRVAGAESSKPRRQAGPRRRLRLTLEQLEDRSLPSNYTAATVSDLIADIHAANLTGGSNTITLVPGNTFSLTAVDNTFVGPTGLPLIAANDDLSIVGNGDTIERSAATGTPVFRLSYVAFGASLTLDNLTLQGGFAFGLSESGSGGAVCSDGALTLNGVTVQNNIAQGSTSSSGRGGYGAGGGIFSNGPLTLVGGTKIQKNEALGGNSGNGYNPLTHKYGGFLGGSGLGGGVYIASGRATLSNIILSSNSAQGGQGGSAAGGCGGGAYGGGLYVWGAGTGTVTLTGDTLSSNIAQGGPRGGGSGGSGFGGAVYANSGTITLRQDSVTANSAQGGAGGGAYGGGLYIVSYGSAPPAVYLDAFTLNHTTGNTASTSDPDIHGTWNPI